MASAFLTRSEESLRWKYYVYAGPANHYLELHYSESGSQSDTHAHKHPYRIPYPRTFTQHIKKEAELFHFIKVEQYIFNGAI